MNWLKKLFNWSKKKLPICPPHNFEEFGGPSNVRDEDRIFICSKCGCMGTIKQ
jgi:hypothetical protein